MTEHLSDLTLARLATGETKGLEEAQAHLQQCELCRSRLLERQQSDRDFMATPVAVAMREVLAAQVGEAPAAPPRKTSARVAAWATGLAAAAGIAFALWPEADGVRTKGAFSVELVDARSGVALSAIDSGQPFRVRARCADRCAVGLYHAAGEARPTEVVAPLRLLPGAPTLLGAELRYEPEALPERLIVVFCPESGEGSQPLMDPACARVVREL